MSSLRTYHRVLAATPTPSPSPQGGGERTGFAARAHRDTSCEQIFSRLLALYQRRSSAGVRGTVAIAAGPARPLAQAPERHAREHVVPENQRMHQCGAEMGEESREQ